MQPLALIVAVTLKDIQQMRHDARHCVGCQLTLMTLPALVVLARNSCDLQTLTKPRYFTRQRCVIS